MAMYSRAFAVSILCVLAVSCARTHLFMSDHGTNEFKCSDPAHDPAHMTELVHFREPGTAWYMYIDDDPPMMFWYGDLVDGQRPLFYWDMRTDDIKTQFVPRLRRPALDPRRDRLIYEVYDQGKYILRAKRYDELEGDTYTDICSSSEAPFACVQVDPGGCDKIFWLKRQGTGTSLMEYDMKREEYTEHINSFTCSFLAHAMYIAIDPARHHLYWSQNLAGGEDDLIGRVNYIDGSGEERWIHNVPGGSYLASYPAQIAIDHCGRRIYWADMNMNWVASAKMDGETLEDRDVRILARYPSDTPSRSFHPTSMALAKMRPRGRCRVRHDEERVRSFPAFDPSNLLPEYEIPPAPPGFVYPFE